MEEQSADGLVLSLLDPVTGVHFIKEVRLREGQRAIYLRHVIGNLEGRFTYGHHPILAFPEAARPGAVRTGAIRFGQVYPGVFEDPATGGKSCLAPGARFTSLAEVPWLEAA